MIPFEKLIKDSLNIEFDLVIKWALAILIFGYSVFAYLVLKQVNLMTAVLGTNLSPAIKAFAWLHLLGAIIALLIVLVS